MSETATKSKLNRAIPPGLFGVYQNFAHSLQLGEAFRLLGRLDRSYLTGKIYPDIENPVALPFHQWGTTTDLFKPIRIHPLIWFFGGPPDYREWWLGTLTTYVTDCLCTATIAKGKNFVFSEIVHVVKGRKA